MQTAQEKLSTQYFNWVNNIPIEKFAKERGLTYEQAENLLRHLRNLREGRK
jgi:hypothetical protein